MIFIAFLFISISAYTNAVPLTDEDTRILLLEGVYHKPTHFSQPFYRATILEDNSIDIMDGPVVLENAHGAINFVITSDNYEYYAINVKESSNNNEKQIQIDLTSTEPTNRSVDVIILEALNEDNGPVGRTTILMFNSMKQFDMYKMKFKIDGIEYIVLNYYYFKWFLALLTITGVLILVIECHEVAKNIKTAKERQEEVKYKELQDM